MECNSLEEIRKNIDNIDRQIISLIAKRVNYVAQASKFKKDKSAVQDSQRVEAVIQKVKNFADEYGANPNMVEKLYRDMIDGFISMEMSAFEKE